MVHNKGIALRLRKYLSLCIPVHLELFNNQSAGWLILKFTHSSDRAERLGVCSPNVRLLSG